MGREMGRLIGLGHGGHTLSVGTEVDLIKTSYPPVCQEKKADAIYVSEMYTQ